jgi:CTP:molybdopterin cytidylyltransferase MocA
MARIAGIVLAAGAGTRAGGPKALRRDPDGTPWVARAVGALRTGGCDEVLVVLGDAAEEARPLVPVGAAVVVAEDWAEGMSASLRAGLATAPRDADAVVVTLVDLPSLPAAAVTRLLEGPVAPDALRRMTYGGRPGHPVLLGRDHWDAIAASATGDRGAGAYLSTGGTISVEGADLWDGMDVDTGG